MTEPITRLPRGSSAAIPPRDERTWVSSIEVVRETGISYRQLDYWTRTGLLTTITEPNLGSGYARVYDVAQVDRATAIRQLLDVGLSLPAIRAHIDVFLACGRIDFGPITLTRNPTEGNAA